MAGQCGMASFTRLLIGRLLTNTSTREVDYPPLLFFAILVLRGFHHESAREETVKFCFSVSPICIHNAQDPSYFATQYKIFFFLNLISGSHCVGSLSSD